MTKILQVKGLYKSYDNTEILKGIELDVSKGEFIAIMGQSGSGKSTLLYNISGMDRPSQGSIVFENQDIVGLSDEEMSCIRLNKMGFVFQKSHLLKTMSIFDNIVLPGFKANIETRDTVFLDAKNLLKRMNISHISDHDIKKVSGGQLQRAAICRALINKPNILFGDEPTGSLNSSAAKEIMDIMNEINSNGTTVILVTHDANVAARADRVIFLSDGQITDEINLGKYNKIDYLDRENKMNQWLGKQLF